MEQMGELLQKEREKSLKLEEVAKKLKEELAKERTKEISSNFLMKETKCAYITDGDTSMEDFSMSDKTGTNVWHLII